MPDRMHMLDTGYPNFSGRETTEDKVTAIQNYLFMLMEELRYLLRHLDADNFSDAGIGDLAESIVENAEKNGDGAISRLVTETLLSNLLNNAEMGYDQLSTSRRIRKFILGDTSDDNFVFIKDQYQHFITGTIKSASTLDTEDSGPLLTESGVSLTLEVGQAATEQAKNRFGQNLYWQKEPVSHTPDGYPLDANGVQIYATTNVTTWPVTVYQYTELVKAQEAFERGGLGNNYLPQIIMGAGDENGNSKGYIYKDEQGFYLRYKSKLAKNVDIVFGDDGFVDAMHRRLSSLEYNTDTGVVLYTVEGSDDLLSMRIREQNGVMTATWPDGHICTIQVSGSEVNI